MVAGRDATREHIGVNSPSKIGISIFHSCTMGRTSGCKLEGRNNCIQSEPVWLKQMPGEKTLQPNTTCCAPEGFTVGYKSCYHKQSNCGTSGVNRCPPPPHMRRTCNADRLYSCWMHGCMRVGTNIESIVSRVRAAMPWTSAVVIRVTPSKLCKRVRREGLRNAILSIK